MIRLIEEGDFIHHLLDLAPHLVCAAAKRQLEGLKTRPMRVDDFLTALERQRLAQTVAELAVRTCDLSTLVVDFPALGRLLKLQTPPF